MICRSTSDRASRDRPRPGGRVTGPTYRWTMRVGLVGCVSEKRSSPAPAAQLYTSALFRGRRAWVERTCDRWFVLSALHGLVQPDAVLDPYDQSLINAGTAERRRWANDVLNAIDAEIGDLAGVVVEIHAGSPYRDHGLATGLRDRGAEVEIPMARLPIGKQLAAYARQDRPLAVPSSEKRSAAARRVTDPRSGTSPGVGAYALLHAHLLSIHDQPQVTMTFAELERILGRALPASARKHRPWWANRETSHSQARGWLDAGWRASKVDLDGATVTFECSTRR